MVDELPDIQESRPMIEIPIQQVGVENVEVPFTLQSRDGLAGLHTLNANVSMRTDIAEDVKGVSMSRFIGTLRDYLGKPLKHKMIYDILKDMKKNMGTSSAYMKFDFKFPKIRQSPASLNSFPLFYKCSFEGQVSEVYLGPEFVDKFKFYQGVTVQYASYCPCSSELCNHLRDQAKTGFPHAQRSFAHVLVETKEPNYVWLEDVIDTVENSIATLPYPIIKRPDEQKIAEIAANNPIFVEDAIRQISQALNDNDKYYDWIVKCVHEESIHTSEAIAMNWKGILNGFNGSFYL